MLHFKEQSKLIYLPIKSKTSYKIVFYLKITNLIYFWWLKNIFCIFQFHKFFMSLRKNRWKTSYSWKSLLNYQKKIWVGSCLFFLMIWIFILTKNYTRSQKHKCRDKKNNYLLLFPICMYQIEFKLKLIFLDTKFW
jgi:hypothetical protein